MRHVRLPTLEYQRRGDLIDNYTSGIYYVKSPQLTMTTYSLTPGNRKKIFMPLCQDKTEIVLFLWGSCGRLVQPPWRCGHSTQYRLLQGPSWHSLEEPPIYFLTYFTVVRCHPTNAAVNVTERRPGLWPLLQTFKFKINNKVTVMVGPILSPVVHQVYEDRWAKSWDKT